MSIHSSRPSTRIHPVALPPIALSTRGHPDADGSCVAYRRSTALATWLGPPQQRLDVLADAHRAVARTQGHGRPAEVARPVAHASVLQLVAEFQAFIRDVHDLAALELVSRSGVADDRRPELLVAVTEGRSLDRGIADLRTLQVDFRRLGIGSLGDRLDGKDPQWKSDKAALAGLTELRSALAHGNDRQLADLRHRGIRDTRTWADSQRPALNPHPCSSTTAVNVGAPPPAATPLSATPRGCEPGPRLAVVAALADSGRP